MVTQVLYAAGLLLFMAAIGIELWDVSLEATQDAFFERQMILVFAVFLLLFVARPLPPRGPVCPLVAVGIGAIGSVFLLLVYPQFHGQALSGLHEYRLCPGPGSGGSLVRRGLAGCAAAGRSCRRNSPPRRSWGCSASWCCGS